MSNVYSHFHYNSMTLEILICTIDQGIRQALKVPYPEVIEGVCYLISWQQKNEELCEFPSDYEPREDVKIVITKGRGLSKNRNIALSHATGDLLVFSDDDTSYKPEYFERIKGAFSANPQADIITFQAVDESFNKIKQYAKNSFLYEHTPRGFYYSSWEIVVKNKPNLPHFDERFGLGSKQLACGEEEVFLHTAHLQGLHIMYCPQIIVQTQGATTGTQFNTSYRVRRSKGAVLYVMHGYLSAVLRCAKFAMKQKGIDFYTAFTDMLYGINYIRKGL